MSTPTPTISWYLPSKEKRRASMSLSGSVLNMKAAGRAKTSFIISRPRAGSSWAVGTRAGLPETARKPQ